MKSLSLSFHDILKININSSESFFINFLKSEFSDFISENPTPQPDLEILWGPFERDSLGTWSPFFDFFVTTHGVASQKKQKMAHGEMALFLPPQQPARLYCHGNKLSLVFFIGEILEPLMRLLLAQKNVALLHASSVVTKNGGILVSGIRHTGKTFTMMNAVLKGARLLADDYTFVTTNGQLLSLPKRVQLLLSHFKEIPELKQIWKKLSFKNRCFLTFCSFVRKLFGDRFVLGLSQAYTDLSPQIKKQKEAPLNRVIVLKRSFGKFETIVNSSRPLTLARLTANNAREGRDFQELMNAFSYHNGSHFPSDWLIKEKEILAKAITQASLIEFAIPDFSPDTVKQYLKAIDDFILT